MASVSFQDAVEQTMVAFPPFVAAFTGAGLVLDKFKLQLASVDYIKQSPVLKAALDFTPLDPYNARANAFRLPPAMMQLVVAALLPNPLYWTAPGQGAMSSYQRRKQEANQRAVQIQQLTVLNAAANQALVQRNQQVVQLQWQVQQLNNTVAASQNTINALTNTVAQRGDEIQQLTASLADLQVESDKISGELQRDIILKDMKISDLTREVESLKKGLPDEEGEPEEEGEEGKEADLQNNAAAAPEPAVKVEGEPGVKIEKDQ